MAIYYLTGKWLWFVDPELSMVKGWHTGVTIDNRSFILKTSERLRFIKISRKKSMLSGQKFSAMTQYDIFSYSQVVKLGGLDVSGEDESAKLVFRYSSAEP